MSGVKNSAREKWLDPSDFSDAQKNLRRSGAVVPKRVEKVLRTSPDPSSVGLWLRYPPLSGIEIHLAAGRFTRPNCPLLAGRGTKPAVGCMARHNIKWVCGLARRSGLMSQTHCGRMPAARWFSIHLATGEGLCVPLPSARCPPPKQLADDAPNGWKL